MEKQLRKGRSRWLGVAAASTLAVGLLGIAPILPSASADEIDGHHARIEHAEHLAHEMPASSSSLFTLLKDWVSRQGASSKPAPASASGEAATGKVADGEGPTSGETADREASGSREASASAADEKASTSEKAAGSQERYSANAAESSPFTSAHARNLKITTEDGKTVTIDGSGTAVGILDDGINVDHPALKVSPKQGKKIYKNEDNEDFYPKVILDQNYAPVGAINDFSRDPGWSYHGMHVAGLVAGNGPESTREGAPSFQGMAPEAQLIFSKIQRPDGPQIVDDSVMAKALNSSISLGADVINLSLGNDSATRSQASTFAQAIESAVSRGAVVVSTSGNVGHFGSSLFSPSAQNPDYGVSARPGLSPSTISTCAMNIETTVERGFDYQAKDGKRQAYFQEPEDANYVALLGYAKDLEIMIPADGSKTGLESLNFDGKVALLPVNASGFAAEDQDDARPDYIRAALYAQERGAKGILFYDPQAADDELPNIQLYEARTINGDWTYLWDEWSNLAGNIFGGINYGAVKDLKAENVTQITFHGARDIPRANPNPLGLADYSSWGVSSDFIFKPDLCAAAAGKIWSLGATRNSRGVPNLTTVWNEGTSMAAPQVSGAAALVKQRLLTEYPELVKNDARSSTLIKNLLMSAAAPQYAKNQAGQNTFISPRGQGNGLVQVQEALNTKVVAVSPSSDDSESGYAKTNLRAFSGNSLKFDVRLENYSHQSQTFTPHLHVLVDEVKGGYYTMKSVALTGADGQALSSVTVPARQGTSLEPGVATVTVNYELPADQVAKLEAESPNGFFVDGFVQFEPDAKSNNQVTLSHAFTGFRGDWFKPALFEDFVYDMKDGQEPFYLHTTAAQSISKRSGDMNATHLETNTKGEERAILGALPDYSAENRALSAEHLAISPNNDGENDFVNPVVMMLRNYSDLRVNVTNAAGQSVFSGSYGLGITDRHKNYYGDKLDDGFVTENVNALRWDGTQDEKVLPEGVYDYSFAARPDYVDFSNPASLKMAADRDLKTFQYERKFKVKVDMTAPILYQTEEVSQNEDADQISFKLKVGDPKLVGTQEAGSGLYRAELVTPSGTTVLPLDALEPEAFADQVITMKLSEYPDAQLRLTDWAGNTKTYTPSLMKAGIQSGSLEITSLNQDEEPIAASYQLVNLQTGQVYNSYSMLPVGKYRAVAYDLPTGYVIDEEKTPGEAWLIEIKADQATTATFHYREADEAYDISAKYRGSEDKQAETLKAIQDHNVQLNLVNTETGQLFKLNATQEGEFAEKLPSGDYQVYFAGTPGAPALKLWNQYNREISGISVSSHAIFQSFGYTLASDSPGKPITITPRAHLYLEGQTLLEVEGEAGTLPVLDVYDPGTLESNESVDRDDLKAKGVALSIADGSGAKVREIPAADGSGKSLYLFDLDDSVVDQLKLGMVLRPRAIAEGQNPLAIVVGYNHLLTNERLFYLKNAADKVKADESSTEEQKQAAKEILDHLGDVDYNYNPAHLASEPLSDIGRDGYIDWDLSQPDKGKGDQRLTLGPTVARMQTMDKETLSYVTESLPKLGLAADSIPILRTHGGGYFSKLRTFAHPTEHDGEYKFVEVPTTTVVNDADAIKLSLATQYGEFKTDPAGESLTTEDPFAIGILEELRPLVAFQTWRTTTEDSLEGVLEDPTQADTRFADAALGKWYSIAPSLENRYGVSVNLVFANKDGQSGGEKPVRFAPLTLRAGEDAESTVIAKATSSFLGQVTFGQLKPGTYWVHPSAATPLGYHPEKAAYQLVIGADGQLTWDGKALSAGVGQDGAVHEGEARALIRFVRDVPPKTPKTPDPSDASTVDPTGDPTVNPTGDPTGKPAPTVDPTVNPTGDPSGKPAPTSPSTGTPSVNPTVPGTSDTGGQGGQAGQGGTPGQAQTTPIAVTGSHSAGFLICGLLLALFGTYVVRKRRQES